MPTGSVGHRSRLVSNVGDGEVDAAALEQEEVDEVAADLPGRLHPAGDRTGGIGGQRLRQRVLRLSMPAADLDAGRPEPNAAVGYARATAPV